MAQDMFNELRELKKIYNNCYINGEKVICYDLIDAIANGSIPVNELSDEEKKKAQKQLSDSLLGLQNIGVTVKYGNEFKRIINQMDVI